MTDLTGWHCTACNAYFQTSTTDPPADGCRRCGRTDTLRRIDHEHPSVDAEVGDIVGCEVIGETREYVVGEVLEVGEDRLVVQARDGTGRYTVKPEQIVERRGGG